MSEKLIVVEFEDTVIFQATIEGPNGQVIKLENKDLDIIKSSINVYLKDDNYSLVKLVQVTRQLIK